jgi:DNA-binding response OmpR family regulator
MSQPNALVIEDDPTLSLIYTTALQQVGFNVIWDIYGDEYPTLLPAAALALVILDLHLPYSSGEDILRDLRAQSPNTVIVIVTADFTKAQSLSAKAEYILYKPISVTRLMKLAQNVKESL